MRRIFSAILATVVLVFQFVGCSSNTNSQPVAPENLTFDMPFVYSYLEVTYGSELIWDNIDFEYNSIRDECSAFGIPISITNKEQEDLVNDSKFELETPSGEKGEVINDYFLKDDILNMKDIGPGETIKGYLYVQYDGDGDYTVSYSINGIPANPVVAKLPIENPESDSSEDSPSEEEDSTSSTTSINSSSESSSSVSSESSSKTSSSSSHNSSSKSSSSVSSESSNSSPTSSSVPNVSTEQKNALAKAKSYLNHMAFSYLGLIEQLEYENYSHEAATYGADNCGADWSVQALKKAKSYLSHMAFSYSGLVEQLEYDQFSSSQAKYGADNCGADWNEQAAKKAKSYLELMSFSRDSLIAQLEYDGFTNAQAVYGVEANGY